MTAKYLIAATVLSLTAGPFTSAQAYSLEGPTWAGKKATFDFLVAGEPSAAFSTALNRSLVIWNEKSAFKWTPVRKQTNPCVQSGPGGAALRTTACGEAFGSGVLGITMFSYNQANHFIHAGTVFNSRANFTIYNGPLRASPDFRRVAIHEMGHALGMGHENNTNIPAIMQPFISDTDRPTADDLRGIRAMYGQP
ncbi:MAG TPA: matrixin family metalloprotease [Alphaproteobacteria bacterium]|jgi:hypothetical protein|nr:matrixin family metalloprotease [Alphaproteobacteria bacterium]